MARKPVEVPDFDLKPYSGGGVTTKHADTPEIMEFTGLLSQLLAAGSGPYDAVGLVRAPNHRKGGDGAEPACKYALRLTQRNPNDRIPPRRDILTLGTFGYPPEGPALARISLRAVEALRFYGWIPEDGEVGAEGEDASEGYEDASERKPTTKAKTKTKPKAKAKAKGKRGKEKASAPEPEPEPEPAPVLEPEPEPEPEPALVEPTPASEPATAPPVAAAAPPAAEPAPKRRALDALTAGAMRTIQRERNRAESRRRAVLRIQALAVRFLRLDRAESITLWVDGSIRVTRAIAEDPLGSVGHPGPKRS